MTRTGGAFVMPRKSACGETAIQEFTDTNLAPELLRQRASPLLNDKQLMQIVQGLTPDNQAKFLEKVDQVCRGPQCMTTLSYILKPPLSFLKAYPTLDSQNAEFITVLGGVCSVTERLPTSAVLSAGLGRHGNIAEDSGGATDIWRGEFRQMHVAIKAFRIPTQNLGKVKRVCSQCL